MHNHAITAPPVHPLDTNVKINRNVLGMLVFIASESMFFLLLIFAYVNFHSQYGTGAMAAWHLDVVKTGMFSIALFASSFTLWLAEKAHEKQSGLAILWMLITIGLGATFMAGQGLEYSELIRENLTISRDMFGTTFFTLTGFHGFHVIVGLILLAVALWMMISTKQKGITDAGLLCVSLYWHFVDVVWVAVFSVVYLWRFVH
ncbi:MAG TPA: cytochrome c oxidase subunit 3 [Oculatellaceae cyanobacterium]